jgi:hypothetical protein
MIHEKISNLIQTLQPEIIQQAGAELLQRPLPNLKKNTIDEVKAGYQISLEAFAAYVRDGDLNKYRDYVQQTTRQQIEKGFSLEEVIAIGDTLAAKVNTVVERELRGPENVLAREKFYQCLKRLSVFGRAAAFNYSMLATKVQRN